MDFDSVFPLQFYLNLNRREDRRRRMQNQLLDHGLHAVHRFPAVDGGLQGGRPCSGRYALNLTQKLCLRQARQQGAEAVLLFEDDAVLHPDFRARVAGLELPEDWGLFYLGAQHIGKPEAAGPGLVRVRKCLDTHAFAVRRPYYSEVLRALSPPVSAAGRGSGFPASDRLLAELQAEIPTYAAFPNLAWQDGEMVSDLTGFRNANYDSRGFQTYSRDLMEESLRRHLGIQAWEPRRNASSRTGRRKVAFLFLTRGEPHHPRIWSEYFAGHEDRISLHAHPKEAGVSREAPEWWRAAVIPDRTETAWGDSSLMEAHRRLLAAALEEAENAAFVLLSESCVPIRPLPELLQYLDRTGWRSMLDPQPVEGIPEWDREKAERLYKLEDVPPCLWRFHSQWCLLNRDVAEFLTRAAPLRGWSRVFAPDEAWIGTQLALGGFPMEEEILPASCTWTCWPPHFSRHPASYLKVEKPLVRQLQASQKFFARKFLPGSNIGEFGLHVARREDSHCAPPPGSGRGPADA